MNLSLPGIYVSGYIGQLKERLTVIASLDGITGYTTSFGVVTVLRFRERATGAALTWRASKTSLTRADLGKTFAVTGTVTQHAIYKGRRETLVARCKVDEVQADAAPAAAQASTAQTSSAPAASKALA